MRNREPSRTLAEVRRASEGNQVLDLPAVDPQEWSPGVQIYVVLRVIDNSDFDLFVRTDRDEAIKVANSLEFDFEEGDSIRVFAYDLNALDTDQAAEVIYFRDEAPYIRKEG